MRLQIDNFVAGFLIPNPRENKRGSKKKYKIRVGAKGGVNSGEASALLIYECILTK